MHNITRQQNTLQTKRIRRDQSEKRLSAGCSQCYHDTTVVTATVIVAVSAILHLNLKADNVMTRKCCAFCRQISTQI